MRNLCPEIVGTRCATRPGMPAAVHANTMVLLLQAFPELDIEDFVPGATVSVHRSRKRRHIMLGKPRVVKL